MSGEEDIRMKTRTPTLSGLRKRIAEPSDGLQEAIRLRAYELCEQRGREGGHELDDWLQAESEVRGKETTGKKAKAAVV